MKVTVWIDYGCEGWSPNDFDSVTEAVEFIKAGRTYGSFRVTTELDLGVTAPPPSPLQVSLDELVGSLATDPLSENEQSEVSRFIGHLRRFGAEPPAKGEPK